MLDRAVSSIEKIGGLFLLAVAILTFIMVILRKFFDTAIPDWFDFSRLMQGIAILWGIAAACYRGGHILVDLVWDLSSPRNKWRIDLFADVVMLIAVSVFAYFAVQAAIEMRGKNLLTSDLRLPQWGFYLTAALGVVAAAFMTGVRLKNLLAGRAHPGAIAPPEPPKS
jgi:TRAP-type C4-dicarboxylate transport system permease small subunit